MKKVQSTSNELQLTYLSILQDWTMNTSFDSPLSPDPTDITTNMKVKAKATAVVNLRNAPRKVHKLSLELAETDDEVYGTLRFSITPERTPNCRCPCAPKPVRTKVFVKLENVRQLVFEENEE